MPKRRYTSKRLSRPRKRRRITKKRARVSNVRPTGGFGASVWVKLEYEETAFTDNTNGVLSVIQYRGNGPRDPDFSGIGGSCSGFTELAARYQSYRCYASKISVTFFNRSTSQVSEFFIVPTAFTSNTNSFNAMLENQRSKPKKMITGTTTGGEPITKIVKFAKTRNILGITRAQMGSHEYGSPVTTEPSIEWRWQIVSRNIDAVTAMNLGTTVHLTYWCHFYEQVQPEDN